MAKFKGFIPKTLIGRLVVLPSIAIVIFFLLISIVIGYGQYKQMINSLHHNSLLLAKEMTSSLEKYILLNDFAEADTLMRRYSDFDALYSIILISPDDKVLIKIEHKKDEEIKSFYASNESFYDLKDKTDVIIKDKTDQFELYYPINIANNIWWLKLGFTKEELYKNLKALIIFGFLMVVFFVFVLFLIVGQILKKPLESISLLTEFSSNLDEKIGEQIDIQSSIKEIKDLSNSLNHLSVKLFQNQEIMSKQNLDLQNFNQKLEKRVEIETQKNRQKDALLLKQARMVALGELISNIAHQWRQPLNIISIGVQDLEISYELDELTDEVLEDNVSAIMEQIGYLSSTIDQFRNAIQSEYSKSDFKLDYIIEQTIIMVSSEFDTQNIKFNLNLQKNLECYNKSIQSFSQVLTTIFHNSKDSYQKFTDQENRIINISLFVKDNKNIIEICDKAGGIDTKIIDKIFDPYFTTKHQSQGIGLGLYFAKMLVEHDFGGLLLAENRDGGT